ncbi:hypothetical protein [Ottowia sp.]|uniref:hypothetical protein n=1 Tax=Ottowia sp. TaxID=1898956 RepID=UPI0025F0D344|nr:hypothetical protein [Ottowia sp.]MBK6616436.1 hypothetical protein [Ottowia sp.]
MHVQDREAPSGRGSNAEVGYVLAGVVLIFVSFVLPWAAQKMGRGRGVDTSAAEAGVLATLLIAACVNWLLVRNRSMRVKARSVAAVGVAVLLMVGSNFVWAAEERTDADAAFVQQATALQAKHQRALEALGSKLLASNLSGALTPEGLTTAAGVSSGKALVNTYRGLLDERKALLRKNHAEAEKFLKTKAVSPGARKDGLAALDASKASMTKLNDELDFAQRRMADAMWKVLTWFEGQVGRVMVRDGKLVFFSKEQAEVISPLFEELRYAESGQKAVLERAAKAMYVEETFGAQAAAASAPVGGKRPAGKVKKKQPEKSVLVVPKS